MPNVGLKRAFDSSSCSVSVPEVDAKVPSASSFKVVKGTDGEYMSAYLMKCEIGQNNNKYYILQALE